METFRDINEVASWLSEHGVSNPHALPDEHKEEYEKRLGDMTLFFPQLGAQEKMLSCTADIALNSAGAGTGKSYIMLMEHLRWIHIPDYNGVVIRRTFSQIFGAGGLFDEAGKIYRHFGARGVRVPRPTFIFPSGAKVVFMHVQHLEKIDEYVQGLQMPVISIDEATQFDKSSFLYLMSRNRSMTGINSYIRMTCNPEAGSFLREMVDWWVDDNGDIINERCGVIRYFVHISDKFIWADTREELTDRYGEYSGPKSFTVIKGILEENKALLEKDPSYRASLQNLTAQQRKSLCEGNWNHFDNPLALFKHATINAHRVESADFTKAKKIVVGLDPCGSTTKGSDDCGIVAAFRSEDGHAYVTHDITGNYVPHDWAKQVISLYDVLEADEIVAESNFGGDMVKSTIEMVAKMDGRSDVNVKMVHSSRGKVLRAQPLSALYEKGLIHHVGNGLVELEKEMCSFTEETTKSPNRLDALVFALTRLMITSGKRMPRLGIIK